ncbi:tRNA uridine-5-carboxymethylaminomethyl(34) synthesis enzyme MnmG [Lacrimispora sp. 210928-DFI.3.58]|uniref:tRNA uridine-5-carboxymethylaminomethyl(34) synthesis enzyme MnmG n=1 Tax=Lacrimispora sp. 210928-DFI.3.58 TaxID=2883214 RepID=UPI001D06B1EA|nr:tRNA uridine-5-carboxymethylaminomethyl(34) synthesis enzyme MnmG [Lacrimispora sp. 210928-DFI.3.58]MCB7319379.1 tRNA uridine-5-carboxymethylaminomethyl(34) synthesis enzyme MnmG [Lacrimispora sp. 210928-DFI.3.58]
MPFLEETYDIAVVGAGHAGCEAALACARLGLETILFTVSIDSIALMPCNPNVGGSSKGHLVRELDALGGEMGKNIDKTFIQSKMLNESKGPAVHSLRAQADKQDYSRQMRRTLENTDYLTIRQAEVSEILVEEGSIRGVKTFSGAQYHTKAVVLCTGTYLRARCIYGDVSNPTGPNGLQAANHLTDSLIANGIEMFRFKTGTPARVDKRSIDFTKMEEQFGDERVVPFSFSTDPESVQKEQVSCWLTYTNEETHRIIRDNLDRSPLFSGAIEGTGPRYCPSIEDKVVKFPDKNRHQVFVEPEGLYTNEMYLGGMSSSLPEDVQYAMYRTVPGLEHVRIVRNAYAIEYDCINSLQLKPTLEFKKIRGLFAGGQFNGSSGYEEAAVQGFMAGVNAAMEVMGREQVVLDRSQAYIGVLIDDLVTKENHEPYRMMTSRAEYRLLLRQDNADIRLREIGYKIGLVGEEEYRKLLQKVDNIQKEIIRLEKTTIGGTPKVQNFLEKYGSTPLKSGTTMAELVKRPELDYEKLAELDEKRPELPSDVREQVNIEMKYEGYIKRQRQQVAQFKKLEGKRLPEGFDYAEVKSLRREAVQKLNKIQPSTVGQASRISGVSPADISVLLVHFAKR